MKRTIRIQLALFVGLTVLTLLALGLYYLQLPKLAGIGQYSLRAELTSTGGLYPTANVTYRGRTIGRITSVEPTRLGVVATMSIGSDYKIPADATANVHSVSAVGEQYLDLVSDTAHPTRFFAAGQVITKSTVPSPIGPALDATNRSLAALPQDKISALLDETARAVGGIGPSLHRLVDATQAIAGDLNDNISAVDDIIDNTGPLLDSQVSSGNAIAQWSAHVRSLAAQAREQDSAVKGVLQQAGPTADQLNEVLSGVREALPQTLGNLEVVVDMLKRYNKGVEQGLVFFPQGGAIAQSVVAPFPNAAALDFRLNLNSPPPCMSGFLPASEWRSMADTTSIPPPPKAYCKIPQDTPGNVVRGARNYPCADIPGKRAATPEECRSRAPYVPAGTNPWYGDPNQILNCPAPGARCDQAVKPGQVIPAPSINNGMNPLPANQLPQPQPPASDPLSRPGQGSVRCSGQQPNPCIYTPSANGVAIYLPSSGVVVSPDGQRFEVSDIGSGEDVWKRMLNPLATTP